MFIESSWCCSRERPTMARSSERSRPEQKCSPAPRRTTMPQRLSSATRRARVSSWIIAEVSAFRRCGRFSVMVRMRPASVWFSSTRMVVYFAMAARPSLIACSIFCSEETLLFHAGVLFRNGVVRGDDQSEVLQRWQGRAEPGQRGERGLRGHVADQNVLGEGEAAESTDGGVEATAAGAVGGGDLRRGFVGACMQVDAEFYG